MADVTIFGFAPSNYVWTTRLTCEEKGISHELKPVEFGSPEHVAMHPFRKIPAVRHGDHVLYETSAICRYLDEVFDGPALRPAGTLERFEMEKWISAFTDYYIPALIRRFVLQVLFPKGPDGKVDRSVVDPALEEGRDWLAVLDTALDGEDFLAAGSLSIADLFMVPIVSHVRNIPEGANLLAQFGNVLRVHDAFMARPSFAATKPDIEAAKAA
ncbi:MAG: glutathione S-transferase family protein [Rhodospirillales bacterium]|nr:glutathione S-transferase family protein [Rhodospirillales bacterium]